MHVELSQNTHHLWSWSPREYLGHSSHVMCVRFSPHNKWVLSVGGKDRGIIQWRVEPDVRSLLTPAVTPVANPEVFVYEAPRKRLLQDMPGGGAATSADKKVDRKAVGSQVGHHQRCSMLIVTGLQTALPLLWWHAAWCILRSTVVYELTLTCTFSCKS